MKKVILFLFSTLILIPSITAGVDITSVYPNPAIIGEQVTIIGGPFSSIHNDSPIKVVLGGQVIAPTQVDDRQLTFKIPHLDVGIHALYLLLDQEKSGQTFNLHIKHHSPEISSLEPAIIDECSTEIQHRVLANGNHFSIDSQLLLDNQIVSSTRLSDTKIEFSVLPLKAGAHGVQVINSDGSKSLPYSLWFNNVPEIYDVIRGDDFISTYQLIISGKNFVHNASLIIYEYPVGQSEQPPRQQVVHAQGNSTASGKQSPSETFIYLDCNTLIYNRRPYTRQDKRIILRVGNPDGKQTKSYEMFTP